MLVSISRNLDSTCKRECPQIRTLGKVVRFVNSQTHGILSDYSSMIYFPKRRHMTSQTLLQACQSQLDFVIIAQTVSNPIVHQQVRQAGIYLCNISLQQEQTSIFVYSNVDRPYYSERKKLTFVPSDSYSVEEPRKHKLTCGVRQSRSVGCESENQEMQKDTEVGDKCCDYLGLTGGSTDVKLKLWPISEIQYVTTILK